MSQTAACQHLADNLREVRQRHRLTQAKLAALSGVPRSTIASIESGASNPTLSVLSQLAGAVRLSLEELLSAPRGGVQRFDKGSLPTLKRARGRVTVAKLLPHPIPGMEIDRMTIHPGGRLVGVPHRPGTHEYLICEAGPLGLRVAGETLHLEAGDVAAFPGDQRHSYFNDGPADAIGFSVVTLGHRE